MKAKNLIKKKQFKMPHMFVMLLSVIFIASLLTYVIPAGEYARTTNDAGIKVVIADQFSHIAKTPVHFWEIPAYLVRGFGIQKSLIFMCMFAGGAFHILLKTGALHALIALVVRKFGNKEAYFIPLLMLICGLIATTQSVTIFIAFTPILVMMAKAMGFDSLTGASITILGGAIGFFTGTLNASSTLVAQTIAELPPYSGIGYRFFSFFCFWVLTSILVVRYAKKVKADPTLSPMYDLDKQENNNADTSILETTEMDTRKLLCLLTLVGCLSVLVYGCISWGWGTDNIATMFVCMAILVGAFAGYTPSEIAIYFTEGCKKLLATAFMIGIAKAIAEILSDASVMDTIVHALAQTMNAMPGVLKGMSMFWANLIINLPITSASGQAGAVMPIFTPLGDMIGLTRQTTVLAYNFGDGMCNYVLPWSTALIGNLAVANIPYDRWMRYFWKNFLSWIVLGSVLVFIAQLIGLGPF
jgi:uncharacterized ion transporter superfamily protein YfcC